MRENGMVGLASASPCVAARESRWIIRQIVLHRSPARLQVMNAVTSALAHLPVWQGRSRCRLFGGAVGKTEWDASRGVPDRSVKESISSSGGGDASGLWGRHRTGVVQIP